MANKGWKNKKTPIIVGTETAPTKMESGQVIINKKATKQNLDKLIEINNDGLNAEKSKVSTDGTDGGILKGKPHYDSKGNSLGGIPVIVDGGKKIEVEGEEFVVNREASQKHWKELSKINQSAGNGVPINPSDVGSDEDPQEFRKGGTAKIIFNPNHIPNKWIYSYAKKVKEEYPKVWDMGGNIFGNEAFKNLERVIKRGYWTDNEEWMYIKWQSYVARHHKDFRIAGTVAMLKWVDKTDKGWDYMKVLIEKEIAKKYPKKGFKRKLSGGGEVRILSEGDLVKYNHSPKAAVDAKVLKIGGNKIKIEILADYMPFKKRMSDKDDWFGTKTYADPDTLKQTVKRGEAKFVSLEKIEVFDEIKMSYYPEDQVFQSKEFNDAFKKYLKNKMAEGGGVNDKLAFIRKNENGNFWLYEINEKGNNYQEIDGSKRLSVVKDMAKRWGYKLVSEKYFNDNYKLSKGGYLIDIINTDGEPNILGEGGGVKIMPKQGTLLTKDKKLKLDYKKNGNNFEFVVYDGKTKPVANYTKTSFKKKENGVVTMDYNQFMNYIYAEGYIDDKNYDLGGGVDEFNKWQKENKPNEFGVTDFELNDGTDISIDWKNSIIIISKKLRGLDYVQKTENFAPKSFEDRKNKYDNFLKRVQELSIGKTYFEISNDKMNLIENKLSEGGGVEFIPEKKGTLIRGNEIIKYFEKVNGNYRLLFYTLNESKGKVPTKCDAFGYCKEFDSENLTPKQLAELIKKNNLMEDGGGLKDITCKSCNWSWNKSDSEKHDEYVCHKCGADNKMKYGGELAKGIKAEREHIDTAKKLYNQKITPNEAAKNIAKEHLKDYSKMETIDFDKHYDEIKTKYADGGNLEPTYTLNTPSGDKSRLTYLQQVLVRTSTFKNFFGDWETAAKNYLADNKENYKQHFENVSKVMDMSILEPRVVYHGTRTEKEFFMFDVSKEKGQGRPYAYFAHNIEYSKNFTDFSQRGHSNSQGILYECFLNVRNPFMALSHRYETKRKNYDYWLTTIIGTIALDKYDTVEKNTKTKNLESAVKSQIEKYLKDSATDTSVPFWYYMARDTNSEFKYFLLAYGYDGIFYGEEYATDYDVTNPKEYTNAVCIFTANDIKLADGRNLNFDPMNADIRYEKGGVPEQKAPTEHTLNKKEALGNLLFGEKYAKGGATSKSTEETNPMFEKEPDNNRKFVDELIKKMKQ